MAHQPRRDIDWQAIKTDYFADALSLRAMALKHGCSHSAIANFARRNGWVRASKDTADGEARRRGAASGDPRDGGRWYPG